MSDIFNLEIPPSSDPFNVGNTSHLREGFNSFINRRPNWMVYIRKDIRYPSPVSYDPHTLSPDTDDPTTFGLGYAVQYEKHAVRRVIRVKSAESPMEEFGYLAKFQTVIYCPRYYYPKSKDIYLEVEWDVELPYIEQYGKPIRIVNAFQVDEQIALKEDEVTYFGCGCDTYNFTIGDQDLWLKELGQVWASKIVL
jgi:hypothetical protein